jgi:hypothetical protein
MKETRGAKDRVATRVDSAQGQARMPQQGRILRDETRASQSAANKGTSQNWNNKGKATCAILGTIRKREQIRKGTIRPGTIAV